MQRSRDSVVRRTAAVVAGCNHAHYRRAWAHAI